LRGPFREQLLKVGFALQHFLYIDEPKAPDMRLWNGPRIAEGNVL
jgi:hypothetical protein